MSIFAKPGVLLGHCDFQDPATFAQRCANAKLAWAAIHVADGLVEADTFRMPEMMSALRSAGVRVGIWQFLQTDPVDEAALADSLIAKYDDAGHTLFYIADAEAPYKSDSGGDISRSKTFVAEFRKRRLTRTAALSSYGAATLDNLLGSVFDYKPWQNPAVLVPNAAPFEFMPQAYAHEYPELDPMHCVEQALANGWPLQAIHPTIGVYTSNVTGWRWDGARWLYLLRNVQRRWSGTAGFSGWSIFNAETLTDDDLISLAQL